jgi:glycosyltransferase involved in cell wall biosynthesis
MYEPLVSIVLPTYNRAHFLRQSIRSVVDQEYENWELLVIDNNSTDDTDDVITYFSDDRIKLYKINNEGLIGRSRNLGIKQSKGEWIAFLDSDDYWFPNKLSASLEICSNKVDFMFHDLQISVDDRVKYFSRVKGWRLNSPVLRDLLIRGNAIANSSVMVRKFIVEKIGGISEDAEVNPCVDYNTWLKIAAVTNLFEYLPKTLGVYRVHGGGVSQRDMSFSHEKAISEFLYTLSASELTLIRRKIAFVHARYKFINKQFKDITPLLYSLVSRTDLIMTAKIVFMLLTIPLFRIFKK